MKRIVRSLVVDDDPTTRLVMKKILAEFGPVAEATNGLEGVHAFRHAVKGNEPFHLITLDLSMPVMDGAVTLECMRGLELVHHTWPRSVILILTSVNATETVLSAKRLGADGYLIKPVDAAQVEGRVRALFNIPPSDAVRSTAPKHQPPQEA